MHLHGLNEALEISFRIGTKKKGKAQTDEKLLTGVKTETFSNNGL